MFQHYCQYGLYVQYIDVNNNAGNPAYCRIVIVFAVCVEIFEQYKFSWISWHASFLSTKINPQQLQ